MMKLFGLLFFAFVSLAQASGISSVSNYAPNNVGITGGTISGTTMTGNTMSGGTISGTTMTGNTISGGTVSGLTAPLAVSSGGTGANTTATAFAALAGAQLLTTHGYQTFGNLIVEWQTASPSSSCSAISWPLAFPHAFLGMSCIAEPAAATCSTLTPNTTGASVCNSSSGNPVHIIVIGY